MSKLRDSARGQVCTIRLPGICNFDPATTVGCHFRLIGLSGMARKPPDFLIAFGCSACHEYVDSHKDDETQLAFAHGVFRTQLWLAEKGVLKW